MTSPNSPSDPRPDRDPSRDPSLRAELRRRDLGAWDPDVLRVAIVAGARDRLAEIERGDAWWDWTARWGRAAIPMALAAGIIGVAAVTLLTLPAVEEQQPLRAPGVAFATVASPAETGAQLMDSLVVPATHDWVLTGAVSR